MGVDCHDFIREAHRILKPGGALKIVEVRSRFEGNNNQQRFRDYLEACGFGIRAVDTMGDNKMFFDVECVKSGPCPKVRPLFALKACQYKKR
jgi:ribosomal RNA-processing protein 8